MKHLTKNKKKMAKYDVLEISEIEAYDLSEKELPAFKCELDAKYYTYTDTDTADGVLVEIDDAQNDEMFIIEWNGGAPIINRPQKMFPR